MSLASDLLKLAESKGEVPPPKVRQPKKTNWDAADGTWRSASGIKHINVRKATKTGKPDTYTARAAFSDGNRKFLGHFANLHSAVVAVCKALNCVPMNLKGMTPELWDRIKDEPIIETKKYLYKENL